MNRQRLSLIVVLLAIPVVILLLMRGGGDGPEVLAERMDEARGFALGAQLAADFPGGGLVVFTEPETGIPSRGKFAGRIEAGLKSGAGPKFSFKRFSPRIETDPSLPAFLAERVGGNEHLGSVEQVLNLHPGCVAIVARVDASKPVPSAPVYQTRVPLYALGYGDEMAWQVLLDAAIVRAVQVENLAGIGSPGTKPGKTAAMAKAYYRVIKKPAAP